MLRQKFRIDMRSERWHSENINETFTTEKLLRKVSVFNFENTVNFIMDRTPRQNFLTFAFQYISEKRPNLKQTLPFEGYFISDEWAHEEGRNKYFEGTRYNRAWVLGRGTMGSDTRAI